MFSAIPRALSLICLACLPCLVRAEPIRDDGRMFHAAAIDRAEQKIARIHQSFDYRLLVRTTASVAPGSPHWFPPLRTPRVNRMLEDQVEKLADESNAPGIYIVICNRPRDVHVVIRPEANIVLSRHDAETLRQTLIRDLHDKGADAALLNLVDRVEDILQDHAERGESPVVNGLVLIGLLGGGFVLWLVLRLIRRRIEARSGSEREFLSRERPALLGTMLGFPAGLWISDKLGPVVENTPLSDVS